MSSHMEEMARRTREMNGTLKRDLQRNDASLHGNGKMHDEDGVYNPYWDCMPLGHDDVAPSGHDWETVRPLRHTASRAPAPDWQRSVASLWDEVSRFEGLEEALCTPGEERFVVFTQRECTVEEHSHHRTVGDVRRIRR
jgi:hypothetical protein